MSWLTESTPGISPLDRVLGLRPELARDLQHFHALFWERRLLPPALLELVRLHVARLLDCRSELGHRHTQEGHPVLAEDKIASLAEIDRSPLFSETERACLAFADKFVFDVHGIEDTDVAKVHEQLGTAATVALTEWLALCDGFMRLRRLLGIEPLAPLGTRAEPVPAPTLASTSLV